jgi:2-desacetyl-2-hydroxyethyl bacteriochlorophyllide A dehydrogenase
VEVGIVQAVIFKSPGKISVTNVPDPVIKEDEVLISVKASGVCGTDVHIYEGDFIGTYPIIPGHEFSGDVIEVSKNVTTVKLGDRVAVDPGVFCRKCSFCRENRQNFCENFKAYGVFFNGGFAELAAIKEENVYKIDGLSYVEGAMVEPVGCGIHGMKQINMEIGDHVLIFGCGPIGLILMQLCKNYGSATITMVDTIQKKLDLAKELGATNTLLADTELTKNLKDIRSDGFHVVIDATGRPSVVQNMFNYVRNRGKLLFFGVCPQNGKIEISPYDVYKRELKIFGTFAILYTAIPAIDMIREKKINVEALVSHKLPLNEFPTAMNMMMDRTSSMKIIIEPNAGGF